MAESERSNHVDVVIVGAGVLGLHQLHLLREAGFRVRLVEEGAGVGGTWYWNRYPEARFDSESYTYGFFFSEELFREWEWSEEYAGQPEIERYFNHAAEKLGLFEDIELGARVVSGVWDESSATWTTETENGTSLRSRFVVAATGVLSVPYVPEIEGRASFRGEQHHTARWPAEGVEVHGKRVAVIGNGSSGTQVIPAIVDEVSALTLFQRTANWVTPLNNSPISAEKQRWLKENYEHIKKTVDTSPSGFLTPIGEKHASDDSPEQRQEFYEQLWRSGGFSKLGGNYRDMLTDPAVNKEWCDFISAKVRSIVKDPRTADLLIPADHGYGAKRPPFGNGFYEAFNRPHATLVSLRETPIVRITETGIETTDGHADYDVIVWATGFDFGTGAINRMGVVGRGGETMNEHWSEGPRTYLGIVAHGFPNLFFPGGPHGSSGNNPRYGGDQVEFTRDALVWARANGIVSMEASAEAEQQWTDTMNGSWSSFTDASYFLGSNIPGKPVKQLLNPTGRWNLQKLIAEQVGDGFPAFDVTGPAEDEPAA